MIYKSNVDSVLGKLKNMFSDKEMDKMYLEMAQNMYRSNLRRVHVEGKSVLETSLRHYSYNPLYVNPVKAGVRKIALKGKTGKAIFKNGKKHKTAYFSNYGSFKTAIGFSRRPNLQVTGRLKADWVIQKSRTGYVIGFRSKYGKEVSEGNEANFHAKIWGVSRTDKKNNELIIKKYLSAKH